MEAIVNIFKGLATADLQELGAIWEKWSDELQAADQIIYKDHELRIIVDSSAFSEDCSKQEIADAIRLIVKEKLHEFQQSIDEQQWKELKAHARRFDKENLAPGNEAFDKVSFNKLYADCLGQPILDAIKTQWPYRVEGNPDGTFALTLFGIQLSNCATIDSKVLADYLLTAIFRRQFQSVVRWSGPMPIESDG